MRYKSSFRRLDLDFRFLGKFHKDGAMSKIKERKLNNKLTVELFEELGLDTLRIKDASLKFDECLIDKGVDHISECKNLLRITFLSNVKMPVQRT